MKDISDFESGDELKEFQHIMDFPLTTNKLTGAVSLVSSSKSNS
ncbi:unnamed protein product [Rhodiola kirilowii]